MKEKTISLVLVLSLLLSGCSGLLERSYSSAEPHSATYWESGTEDTLRADSYQDLVNALLLLVSTHADEASVRVYGQAENEDMKSFAERACSEVQRDTPMGAYMLDYITYSGEEEKDYYELHVRFGYRRTEEEQAAIVGATNSEAIPDLLEKTFEEGGRVIAIRVSYSSLDPVGIRQLVWKTQRELLGLSTEEPVAPEKLWQVVFYPDSEHMGIVEVILEGSGIVSEEMLAGDAVPADAADVSDRTTQN